MIIFTSSNPERSIEYPEFAQIRYVVFQVCAAETIFFQHLKSFLHVVASILRSHERRILSGSHSRISPSNDR